MRSFNKSATEPSKAVSLRPRPLAVLHIDHSLPGRIRFRMRTDLPPERLLDEIAWAVRKVSPSFELRYNPGSRRFLLEGARDAPLGQVLEEVLAADAEPNAELNPDRAVSPATESEPQADPWVRRETVGVPGGPGESAAIAAAKLVVPRIAKFLLMKPFIPPVVRPFLAMRAIWPYLRDGWEDAKQGRMTVATLDASAIAASVAMGDFGTAQTIAFLLDLGDTLEQWTRQRTRESLSALFHGEAQPIWVRRDDVELSVDATEVVIGDLVVVRAGTRIPVDGVVAEGEALVNQSSMTGEAHPVRRAPGLSVYAGTVVTEGELLVDAHEVGDATRFAHIVSLLESSEELKAEAAGEAESLAQRAVPWTYMISAAVLAVTGDWRRAASVLVVDYSCALKLATPLAVKAAMIESAAHGAVIKGGLPLERLSRVDAYLLDKTGTLTQARPKVVDVIPTNGYSKDFVLRHAACLEEHFPHPVATAVVHAATELNLHHEERHAEVEYVLAHGIASSLDGKRILVGCRHFVEEDEAVDVSGADEQVSKLAARGYSVLYVSIGGKLAGLIAIEDPILEDAPGVVDQLRQAGGKRIVLLTGDNEASAREVAGRLGITEVHAEVLPDDKVHLVQALQAEGHTVAMVGDGMNDSAALAHADVGISVAHGADVAREACDVLLLQNRLAALPDTVRIAQRAFRRTRANFALTIGANTAFMALGLVGIAPAALLAVLHNATTVAVCVLAMRPLHVPA